MYKLFLTLRYLTRKKIVIFPILVVWLCVMMMIIAIISGAMAMGILKKSQPAEPPSTRKIARHEA